MRNYLSTEGKKEVRARYQVLRNAEAVSKVLGVPTTTVRRVCRDLVQDVNATLDTLNKKRDDAIVHCRRELREGKEIDVEAVASSLEMTPDGLRNAIMGRHFKHLNSIEPPYLIRIKKVEERERARAMRLEGLTYPQIAKALGVAKSSISAWCKDIGEDRSLGPRPVDDETKQKVRNLYSSGLTANEVSQQTGISDQKVGLWCADLITARKSSVEYKERFKRILKAERNKANLILTDDQVLELRRDIRLNGKQPWRVYAAKYKCSVGTISTAARGASFVHLNAIEPPVDTAVTLRTYRPRKRPKLDEELMKEALRLRWEDPDAWSYKALADWLSEKTNRKYKANHVAIALRNRDPSVKSLDPPIIPKEEKPKREPIVRIKKIKKTKPKLTPEEIKQRAVLLAEKRRLEREAINRLIEEEDRREAAIAAMSKEERLAWEATLPQP